MCLEKQGIYILHYPNDDCYKGEIKDAKTREKHGTGTMHFTGTKDIYKGAWMNDEINGKGTWYFKGQKTKYYSGEWQNSLPHGLGVFHFDNNETYTGRFYRGKANDNKGEYLFTNGDRF